jgi:uncharacterized protein involved in exopolysaccharide biosynthesis
MRQPFAPVADPDAEGGSASRPGPATAETDRSLWLVVSSTWRVLAVVALTCGAVAFAASYLIQPVYEARATLILTPADRTPAAQVAAVTNTRTLLESRTLAAQVLDASKLNQPPHLIDAETFIRECLEVAQIRDTNYLRLTLRLPSAALAADVLNALVEKGIELNRQLTIENATSVARGLMKSQLDEARGVLDKRTKELEAFRTTTQLEVLRKEVEQLTDLRSVITDLDADIQSERARVAEIEQQLARRPRVLDVPRAMTGEGPLLEHSRLSESTPDPIGRPAATPAEPPTPGVAQNVAQNATALAQHPTGPLTEPQNSTASEKTKTNSTLRTRRTPAGSAMRPEAPPALAFQDPFIDPVYEVLDYQLATARHKLAARQAQRAELVRKGSGPLTAMYAGEARLLRLELEQALATQVYKDLVLRYEQARENAVSHSASIQVADSAVRPRAAVAPNRALLSAIGMSVGLLAAMTFLLVAPYRRLST